MQTAFAVAITMTVILVLMDRSANSNIKAQYDFATASINKLTQGLQKVETQVYLNALDDLLTVTFVNSSDYSMITYKDLPTQFDYLQDSVTQIFNYTTDGVNLATLPKEKLWMNRDGDFLHFATKQLGNFTWIFVAGAESETYLGDITTNQDKLVGRLVEAFRNACGIAVGISVLLLALPIIFTHYMVSLPVNQMITVMREASKFNFNALRTTFTEVMFLAMLRAFADQLKENRRLMNSGVNLLGGQRKAGERKPEVGMTTTQRGTMSVAITEGKQIIGPLESSGGIH
ncbi:hypothetical protein HDU93_007160 [Gonapodya sp. JEL0774]|nr:hypothetical protein HDU93_007160 [Gonapodya sp. JEL0774]